MAACAVGTLASETGADTTLGGWDGDKGGEGGGEGCSSQRWTRGFYLPHVVDWSVCHRACDCAGL